jgi:hypothetical protein
MTRPSTPSARDDEEPHEREMRSARWTKRDHPRTM